jgi:hypothetical protein
MDRNSTRLVIRPETLEKLETKFGKDELNNLVQEYETAENIEKLTESQARYLLRSFDSIDALRDYFATAGQETSQPTPKGTLRSRQEKEPTGEIAELLPGKQ